MQPPRPAALVADDSVAVRRLVAAQLRRDGYDVRGLAGLITRRQRHVLLPTTVRRLMRAELAARLRPRRLLALYQAIEYERSFRVSRSRTSSAG